MELVGNFKFLGIEKGTSRDGKEYTRLGILQGLNSEIMFVADDIATKASKFPALSDVVCHLSINVKDDRTAYVNLKDIILASK